MRFWDFASPKMRGTMARAGSCAHERQHMTREQAIIAVPDTAEDLVVRNLIEALNRIHADLERIEVWTAALPVFKRRLRNTSRVAIICCRRASRQRVRPDREETMRVSSKAKSKPGFAPIRVTQPLHRFCTQKHSAFRSYFDGPRRLSFSQRIGPLKAYESSSFCDAENLEKSRSDNILSVTN